MYMLFSDEGVEFLKRFFFYLLHDKNVKRIE